MSCSWPHKKEMSELVFEPINQSINQSMFIRCLLYTRHCAEHGSDSAPSPLSRELIIFSVKWDDSVYLTEYL